MTLQKQGRLESLDMLRGFDLFCLVSFQPVFKQLAMAMDLPFTNRLLIQFQHVEWEGFVFWDIIMPLFMFMSGVSIPFAFSKYLKTGNRRSLYKRILKRVFILFLLGMICSGNLLALDWHKIYFYSNTLQSIAVGYLISSILYIHFNRTGQIIMTGILLISYWAAMTYIPIGPFGGGNFSPDWNLAEYIDRTVLGRFRDRAVVTENGIDFGNYRYTWILSSLNFGVTVMTGVFAGQLLKANFSGKQKMIYLVLTGVCMIVAGRLWGIQMPIIKRIWSSSMTLYSSGICFLLMALFYYLVDYRKHGKYLNWLKVYGMNSIIAYMFYELINFSCITTYLLRGTEQFLGNYYLVLIKLVNTSIIFFILWLLYREKKFLKV